MLSPTEDRVIHEPHHDFPWVRVPLCVQRQAVGATQPVTVGLPFPRGVLTDPALLRLQTPEGEPAALQALPLARWSDGSVKWVLLDLLLPSHQAGESTWSLELSPECSPQPDDPSVQVTDGDAGLVIATGPATFDLARTGPLLLARVRAGGEEILSPEGLQVVLTDREGGKAQPTIERVTLEAAGPVRATVRLEGVFAGRTNLRFVARLSFFAGTSLVRVALTIHNPDRAHHPGGLWDLGDPGSVLFRDLSLCVVSRAAQGASWRAEPGHPLRSGAAVEVYQDSSGGENWQSRNHVNREGRVPCSFRGYRVRAGAVEEHGLRASPVVRLGEGTRGLTAALPEFWQNFPKVIATDGASLRVALFPEEFADLHELQGGEQKTHVVWLDFGESHSADRLSLDWVHEPARVQAPPEWYADSGAVPHLIPRSQCDGPVESFIEGAVAGGDPLLARREVIDEYGWRNFGDLHGDHEAAYYAGPLPIISHYNNQYDVVYGAILQYLRTGDGRWVDLFDPLARHVIDVDLYHTDRDKAAYNGGLFWHTDHYQDAATCSHRTYSRTNQTPGRPYGGGPGNGHNYTTGLLHYYYLSGDPAARDAVLSLADWVAGMDDGSSTPLALFDDGPTGVATATADRDYHGPGRGAGNSVNALLDGWLLTGQRSYLDQAEALIRRVIHPLDDVPGRNLLNTELRWSYVVFLSALDRYLWVKDEAGEHDRASSYARASLLRYATWMVEYEVPYFDHPEKLEFPTETWAAQEFRKANVLRFAATHAEGALRSRMLRRADELADRAWADLTRFARPATTRALALLFVEGMRDSYFRQRGAGPLPRPLGDHDFGTPEVFLSQRTRVLARLKTPGGLFRAVLKLFDVRNWGRIARLLRQRS